MDFILEGASTLTQQLLKNNVFTNWTNEGKIERFKRKIQEQYLALQLEASLTAEGMDTKSVILEIFEYPQSVCGNLWCSGRWLSAILEKTAKI